MFLTILYYFFAGLILDILITVGWYALEKKWVVLSALSAIAQTLLGYTVFYNLFPEGGMSLELVIFAVGGGVGVAGVVIYKKYWSKEK